MGKYFSAFPITSYANVACVDITTSTHLTKQAIKTSSLYYNTRIDEGTRPDTVSHRVYRNSYYDWVIHYSNGITDPYYDWLMTQDTFEAYLKDKYGSVAQAIEEIIHYKVNWETDERSLTATQYNALGVAAQKYWRPSTDDARTYVRKQMDHKVNTNVIANLNVSDPTIFTNGSYVNQISGGAVVMSCEVAFVGDTYITVKNLEGSIQAGTITNVISEETTTLSSGSITRYVIPADELAYWQKVSAYDYELELNSEKAFVRILNNNYLQLIESEHKGKLANG